MISNSIHPGPGARVCTPEDLKSGLKLMTAVPETTKWFLAMQARQLIPDILMKLLPPENFPMEISPENPEDGIVKLNLMPLPRKSSFFAAGFDLTLFAPDGSVKFVLRGPIAILAGNKNAEPRLTLYVTVPGILHLYDSWLGQPPNYPDLEKQLTTSFRVKGNRYLHDASSAFSPDDIVLAPEQNFVVSSRNTRILEYYSLGLLEKFVSEIGANPGIAELNLMGAFAWMKAVYHHLAVTIAGNIAALDARGGSK